MNWDAALQAGLVVWMWYASYRFLMAVRDLYLEARRRSFERRMKMTQHSEPHKEFRDVFMAFVEYTGVSDIEVERKDGKVRVTLGLNWWGRNPWYKRLVRKRLDEIMNGWGD